MVGNGSARTATSQLKKGCRCCLGRGRQTTSRLRARRTTDRWDLLRTGSRSGGEHGWTVAGFDLGIATVCKTMRVQSVQCLSPGLALPSPPSLPLLPGSHGAWGWFFFFGGGGQGRVERGDENHSRAHPRAKA